MTDRTSLYIGQALRGLLDSHPEGAGLWSRSGLLNTVAARYVEIARRHMPTLTPAEWCAVMDALNGTWLQSSGASEAGMVIHGVWASIYDADRLDGLGAKWHCDAKGLAERIRDYDYATTVALVDAVERWWARAPHDGDDYRTSIAAVVGEEHVTP